MKKKLFLLSILFVSVFSVASSVSDVIQVKVSITAERNTYKVKKELVAKAKKEALKKYILRLNSTVPESLLEKACTEYDIFVPYLETVSEDWEDFDKKSGQLVGEYIASLELEKINQWLDVNGFKHQAHIEIIIMEEAPSLGQMKMTEAFGADVDGEKFFIQNYTMYQRRLRDAIVKKVGEFGFDVKLLEDNDMYESYKSKDNTLLGVYFDVENNSFAINKELLSAVKANNPDTLVLFYRIDSLVFEPNKKTIRTSVSFNMKDLNSNVTKSIGSGSYQLVSRAETKTMVIDDLAFCAEAAIKTLMNSQDLGGKLNDIAMSIKNSANVPSAPLKLVINAEAFDAKIRKRAMYMIKKELVAKQLTTNENIKSSNTTLTATITNTDVTEADMLYMEYIDPLLVDLGIELDDEKVFYAKDSLTIKP